MKGRKHLLMSEVLGGHLGAGDEDIFSRVENTWYTENHQAAKARSCPIHGSFQSLQSGYIFLRLEDHTTR